MATSEQLGQMGVVPNENGDLILRYLDQDGRKVTLNLTDYIRSLAQAAVDEHKQQLHGHQI